MRTACSCVSLEQPCESDGARWYIAGTEGTLIADLVRNKMLLRGALDRGKPERQEWGGLTADAHNGADQAWRSTC